MISMLNVGKFYGLARAQLDRTNRGACHDSVLSRLLPADHHPTRPSPTRRIMDTLVPQASHMRFAAASAWLGNAHPHLLVDDHMSDEAMEARARLVDVGAITVPADAPCRTWPWGRVVGRLNYTRNQAALVYGRFSDLMGPYVAPMMADVRHLLSDGWVSLSDEERRGLRWVLDDLDDVVGEETAPLVVEGILAEVEAHWPGPKLVDSWSVDSVARWAGVCHRYVSARRG